jgi:hypothetical protein
MHCLLLIGAMNECVRQKRFFDRDRSLDIRTVQRSSGVWFRSIRNQAMLNKPQQQTLVPLRTAQDVKVQHQGPGSAPPVETLVAHPPARAETISLCSDPWAHLGHGKKCTHAAENRCGKSKRCSLGGDPFGVVLARHGAAAVQRVFVKGAVDVEAVEQQGVALAGLHRQPQVAPPAGRALLTCRRKAICGGTTCA